MRFPIALAALCTLTAAYAPAPTAPAPASRAPAIAAQTLPPLGVMLLAQSDGSPDDKGACIHRVSSASMCNDITRQWCFGGGFASATFYEGITCADAKAYGYY